MSSEAPSDSSEIEALRTQLRAAEAALQAEKDAREAQQIMHAETVELLAAVSVRHSSIALSEK
jgi:hypothetical protein